MHLKKLGLLLIRKWCVQSVQTQRKMWNKTVQTVWVAITKLHFNLSLYNHKDVLNPLWEPLLQCVTKLCNSDTTNMVSRQWSHQMHSGTDATWTCTKTCIIYSLTKLPRPRLPECWFNDKCSWFLKPIYWWHHTSRSGFFKQTACFLCIWHFWTDGTARNSVADRYFKPASIRKPQIMCLWYDTWICYY